MGDDVSLVCGLCKNRISLRGGPCRTCGHHNAPFLGNSGLAGGLEQSLPQEFYRMNDATTQYLPESVSSRVQPSPMEMTQSGSTTRELRAGLDNLRLHSDDTADAHRSGSTSQPQATGAGPVATRGRSVRGGRGGRGGLRAWLPLDSQGRTIIPSTASDSALQVRDLSDAQKAGLAESVMREKKQAEAGSFKDLPLVTFTPPAPAPAPAPVVASTAGVAPRSRVISTGANVPAASSSTAPGIPPQVQAQTSASRTLDTPAQAPATRSRPLGDARPLEADATWRPALLKETHVSTSGDPGHPVLPNPPCSPTNRNVWPYDYEPATKTPIGTVRVMEFPCKCQAVLRNGKKCLLPHPTVLHNKQNRFMEMWCRKRVKGHNFHCRLCVEKGFQGKHNHDTADHGKGMWRVIPNCPIDELDDHLQKFVTFVPPYCPTQPWHISYYNPEDFPPGEGWPALPADLPRFVIGWWVKGTPADRLYAEFDFWCKENRRILGIREPGIPAGVPGSTNTAAPPAAELQVVEPQRIGWSGFNKGHARLAPPDYTHGHYLWFNPDFERDMDKCLEADEREQIAEFKRTWTHEHGLIEGEPSNELKSTMARIVRSAWDIYCHVYPHWTPEETWTAPSTLKDWRNGRRATLRAQRKRDKLNPNDVNLNYNGLSTALSFEPLEPTLVRLKFRDWADSVGEDEDEEAEMENQVAGPREHPQVAARTTEDAEHHLRLWIVDMEEFLSWNESYQIWIGAQKVEGRTQTAYVFRGHPKLTSADLETLCTAQDQAFSELADKVESLICELRDLVRKTKEKTGTGALLICSKLQGDLSKVSRAYEETWHLQLCGYLAKGNPEAIVTYYKSFMANGFDGITEIYEGLLGGYMPFESRIRAALPRLVWPQAFLDFCRDGEDVEVVEEEGKEEGEEEEEEKREGEGEQAVSTTADVETQAAVEPVTEGSVVEASAAETPAAENVAAEGVDVKEPILEEPASAPSVVEKPASEEPAAEEPPVEAPQQKEQ